VPTANLIEVVVWKPLLFVLCPACDYLPQSLHKPNHHSKNTTCYVLTTGSADAEIVQHASHCMRATRVQISTFSHPTGLPQ